MMTDEHKSSENAKNKDPDKVSENDSDSESEIRMIDSIEESNEKLAKELKNELIKVDSKDEIIPEAEPNTSTNVGSSLPKNNKRRISSKTRPIENFVTSVNISDPSETEAAKSTDKAKSIIVDCEPSTSSGIRGDNNYSPHTDDWYSRTIRDDCSDDGVFGPLRRTYSQELHTRYTVDRYADAAYRFYRGGRTGTRRRSSDGDVFVAEQAGREVRVICRCDGGQKYLKRLARGGLSCERRLVVLHVLINGRPETLVFCMDNPPELFREAVLGVAGARPCDNVYLRNQAGHAVALTPNLESNTPATAYTVVVQPHDGSHCAGGEPHQCPRRCARPIPQLLAREHFTCIGLLPQLSIEMQPMSRQVVGGGRVLDTRRSSEPHQHIVWQRFNAIRGWDVTDEEVAALLTADVDSYALTDEKVLGLMYMMFVNLHLLENFPITEDVVKNFLYEVYKHYNEVPFHNFRHSFCVAQMFYAICMRAGMQESLGDTTVLILLVSCICHDLDHPGFNNIYQINARTDLALRYNDISPLENHHCSVAFRILQLHDCNLFRNFTPADFRIIREGMIRCILATDMARHNEILMQFREIPVPLDFKNKLHVNLLTMVLIKVADISNEVRPLPVAEPWLDRLLQEFFAQSDLEKQLGLPITPFMDRTKITKPTSQCAFIGLVLRPLFEALVSHFPELEGMLIIPAREALAHYSILAEELAANASPSASVASNIAGPSGIRSNSVAGPSGIQPVAGTSSSFDNDQPGSPESGYSHLNCPETEVECSEKALKFKIATEGSMDRMSYPSSRKGSREAGVANIDFIRVYHYASSPSPPPLEEEDSREEFEAKPLVSDAPIPVTGGIEVVTEQPLPSGRTIPSTSKGKSLQKVSKTSKSSEKPTQKTDSSEKKSFVSRIRSFTDRMSFRDSPPNSPSKHNRRQDRSDSREGSDI